MINDKKKNDWLAVIVNQPQFDFDDLQEYGITPDNTTIKTEDYYKNLPQIQQIFVDKDGKFDENKFDNFYLGALQSYNEYANNQFTDEIIKSYDPYDWMAPIDAKKKDTAVTFTIGQNPGLNSFGLSNLRDVGQSNFSTREIAQRNKVWDPTSETFLDWSPNDKGGFFKALNRSTLALAIYEEDGIHEINGRKFKHKKGDLRLNDEGQPFYEIITPDKEIYGRDVLHYTDTFTVDGSKWNKYDFFDSDGIDKSLGGVLMKTAVSVAPMLIPGVGTYFGAISAGMALTQLFPILGKSISNFINGDKDTDFEKTLTKIENWGAQFQSSVSDKSREKIATWENLGQLVKDVSLQLFQQQTIGKIPLLFGKTAENAQLGRNLALAYMSATSAQQSYETFKEAGADDRTAGIGTLASMFAMWKLMNQDYFRDSLFKGSWLDESVTKVPIMEAAKETAEAAKFMTPGKAFTWIESKMGEKVADAARKSVGKLKDLGDLNSGKNIFLSRALNEGVEETMEEVSLDLVKALFTGLDALGIPMTTNQDQMLDFGWSVKDMLSRYAISFVGGAIGGPIFELHNRWQNQFNNSITKSMDRSSFSELTYLIAQGREEEVYDRLDALYKKGKLGNKNLSADKFKIKVGKNGEQEIVYEGTDGTSQNDAIYNALKGYVANMSKIMNEEGLIRAITLNSDLKNTLDSELMERIDTIGANSSKLNDLQKLTERIIKLRSELDSITEQYTSSDKKSEQDTLKLQSNQRVQKLQQELSDARTKLQQIKTRELDGYYLNQAKFVLNKPLSDLFAITDIEKYSLWKTKSEYSALNPDLQEDLKNDFDVYMDNEAKYRVFKGYDIYLNTSQAFAERIQQEDESLKNVKYNPLFTGKVQGSTLNRLAEESHKWETIKKGLENKQLSQPLTDEEEKSLKEAEYNFNLVNTKFNLLMALPSSLMTMETTDQFNTKFFNKDEFIEYDDVALQTYANGLKQYYKYIGDNKIISKGDSDLMFLMKQIVTPYKLQPFEQRLETSFRTILEPDIDNYLNDESVNFADDQENPEQGAVEHNGKFYNLKLDAVGVGNTFFSEELKTLTEKFINVIQVNPDEALNLYQQMIGLFEIQPQYKDKAEKFIKDLLPSIGTESIVDYIQEIDQLKQNVKESSFLNLLDDFIVAVNGSPIKLVQLIKQEKQRLIDKHSAEDYVIEDENVEKEIAEIQGYLNVLEALLSGAYSGFNESVNDNSKIYKLATISENTKNILSSEINTLRSELSTLSLISGLNKQRRLNVYQKTAVQNRPKFITKLKDYITSFEKEFVIGTEPIQLQALYDKYFSDFDENNLTTNNFKDYEKKFIDFESELGNLLRSEAVKNKEAFIDKLIKIFGNDLWKYKSNDLTDSKDSTPSQYDLLLNLITITSLDANEFYHDYKNRVIDRDDYKFAPIFNQELAIRIGVAYFYNPELFNLLNDKLSKQYAEDKEYIKQRSKLDNIIAIVGAAGSGKTSATAKAIYNILSKEDIDFFYVAPSKVQLKSLINNITDQTVKDDDLTSSNDYYVKGVLVETLLDGDSLKDHIEYDDKSSHWKFKDLDTFKPNIGITHGKKSVMFIDEITFWTEPELQVLSKWAKENNVFIIATGDPTQNSSKIQNKLSGIEDTTVIKTPNLGYTMRVNSVAGIDNFQAMYAVLKQIQDELIDNPAFSTAEADAKTKQLLTKGLRIKSYTQGEEPVLGTAIEDNDKNLINKANQIIDSGSSFLIITDNPNEWKNKVGDKVAKSNNGQILTIQEAQGLQADYVIVDVDWGKHTLNDSPYDILRNFYTLTQRAIKGVVAKNNNIKSILNIQQDENKLYSSIIEISPDQITKFKEWRKAALENLSPITSNRSTSEPRSKKEDDTKKPEEKKPKEKKPEEKKPEEKPKNDVSDDSKNKDTSEDDSLDMDKEDDSGVPPEELKPESIEAVIPADTKEPTDEELRGSVYSNKKPNKEFIKEVFKDPTIAAINNDDYFNWSKNNLIMQQKNDSSSLFNYLEIPNDPMFINLARQISSCVLFNDTFDTKNWFDTTDIRQGVFNGDGVKYKRYSNLFKDVIFTRDSLGNYKLNEDNYDLYIENIGNERFVVIKWKVNNIDISLPIAIVQTQMTGKLQDKHPFGLVRGVTKYKTSTARTISSIKADEHFQFSDPTIIGVNTESILTGAPDHIKDFVFGVKDENQHFIRQPQNGKTFMFATDNYNYTQRKFIRDLRYDIANGQLQYFYQNHDISCLFGVHKAVDPKTLLQSVIALYATLIDSDAGARFTTWTDNINNDFTSNLVKTTLRDKYLRAAGINSVEDAKRLIQNFIPNWNFERASKPWETYDNTSSKNWAEFYKYYNDRSRQVINYNTLAKFISTLLNGFYNNTLDDLSEETKDIIKKNLLERLTGKDYKSGQNAEVKRRYKKGLTIKINDVMYSIKIAKSDSENNTYEIYKLENDYKPRFLNTVKVSGKEDRVKPLYGIFKSLFTTLNLDINTDLNPQKVMVYFNSFSVDLDSKNNPIAGTERTWTSGVNETLYELLKLTNIDQITNLIKHSNFFKDGFFGNDVAGEAYYPTLQKGQDQSAFRRVAESINSNGQKTFGEYTTDTIFEGSIFSLDLTSLDTKPVDNQPNEFLTYQEDLKRIKNFLKEEKINFTFSSIYNQKDIQKSNREQLEQLVNDINYVLKNNATDINYPQISISWVTNASTNFTRLGDIQVNYINSFDNLVSNLLKNIGIDTEISTVNHDQFLTGNNLNIHTFSVTLPNQQVQNFIMKKVGSTWQLKEFLSYPEYQTALELIQTTIQNLNGNLDGAQEILDYFNGIQDNQIDYSIVESYEILMNKYKDNSLYQNIRQTINNYLQKRLKNNEC